MFSFTSLVLSPPGQKCSFFPPLSKSLLFDACTMNKCHVTSAHIRSAFTLIIKKDWEAQNLQISGFSQRQRGMEIFLKKYNFCNLLLQKRTFFSTHKCSPLPTKFCNLKTMQSTTITKSNKYNHGFCICNPVTHTEVHLFQCYKKHLNQRRIFVLVKYK